MVILTVDQNDIDAALSHGSESLELPLVVVSFVMHESNEDHLGVFFSEVGVTRVHFDIGCCQGVAIIRILFPDLFGHLLSDLGGYVRDLACYWVHYVGAIMYDGLCAAFYPHFLSDFAVAEAIFMKVTRAVLSSGVAFGIILFGFLIFHS